MGPKTNYAKWLKEFEAVLGEKGQPKDLLRYYRDLVAIQGDLYARIVPPPALKEQEAAGVKNCLLNGDPIMGSVPLRVEPGLLAEGFRRVGELLQKGTERGEAVAKVLEQDWDFSAIARSLEEGAFEDLVARAQEKRVDQDLFAYILTEAVKPFYQVYAEAYGGLVEQEKWQQKYCPVCGEKPAMAVLEGEGERLLTCDLCGFAWNFPRLVCPYCGAGHEAFREIEVEGEETHRLHACTECQGYLKVVDRRKEKEAKTYNLLLEDLLTIHLDMWAREHGYTRRPEKAEQ